MQDNHVNMTLVSPAMQKEQEVSSRKETGMVRPNDFGSDIRNIDTLRFYIRADFRSRGVQEPFLRAVFADPIVRFTLLMRVLEYANGRGFSKTLLLPLRYWYRRLSIRLGFTIAPGIFGPGLAIVHYGLLVIEPSTRIGRNCRIHAGVNIGRSGKHVPGAEIDRYSPRIGHNVYIGPGAKLYGPITIGDNCVVGANAVVTKSFPEPGLTLAGIPAKIIQTGGTAELVIKGAD
jgi:serine O-acetyltransferase